MNEKNITKEEFVDCETVRQEGKTNMFVMGAVIALAPKQTLTSKKCFNIMKNYDYYKNKYCSEEEAKIKYGRNNK